MTLIRYNTRVPPIVFVSYSHLDRVWKDLLLPQLNVLKKLALVDVWVDERIDAGASWYPEIQGALARSAAAVCLISANYLSSDFVLKEEVPYFLAQREQRGLLLLPVLVSECPWRLFEWIKATQMVPEGARPLDSLPDADRNTVLSHLAELIATKLRENPPPEAGAKEVAAERAGGPSDRVRKPRRDLDDVEAGRSIRTSARDLEETAIADSSGRSNDDVERRLWAAGDFEVVALDTSSPNAHAQEYRATVGRFNTAGALSRPAGGSDRPPASPAPEAIDVSRLPVTGAELFGRAEELRWLDEAWEARRLRVVTLVAWGGVGKSALVNRWLERMGADGYRGAHKVFGWSFFSQGASQRTSSADLFIDRALRFFGDPEPATGSPWSKAERLAALVRASRSLLVLDGIEPLLSPVNGWRVEDPGLAHLLWRLAHTCRGGAGLPGDESLCILTSRERPADLDAFPVTTAVRNIEQMSPAAARALLRVRGVRGTDAELEQLARGFGCQALAVSLVASYLQQVPGHLATGVATIPDLAVPNDSGRPEGRVLEAIARGLGQGPELEVLLLLGLFDQPAPLRALAALRTQPAIPGLTDHLAGLPDGTWEKLLSRLRSTRLIAEEDRQPNSVEMHPLAREHFSDRLERQNPPGRQQGHGRLFDFYSSNPQCLVRLPEDMLPMFSALLHGCKARRYREAFAIFLERIMQGGRGVAVHELCLFGPVLQAISGFFVVRWTELVEDLDQVARHFLLSTAGYCLQAMGRLREAVAARRGALATAQAAGTASMEALAQAELYLTLGELDSALLAAGHSEALAGSDRWALSNIASTLGTIRASRGDLAGAAAEFQRAEQAQPQSGPETLPLYSVRGFQYCELLLDQGNWQEVRRRAATTLAVASGQRWPLNVALDRLSLGRAFMLAALHDDGRSLAEAVAAAALKDRDRTLAQAEKHLDLAVDGLRRSGQLSELPRALLARANLRSHLSKLAAAEDDLDESLDICVRCELRLLEVDTRLGYARLRLAQDAASSARANLERAAALVAATGYRRRDRDLADLAAALGSAASPLAEPPARLPS
jgi:tetratricopeptide (TPR) repeat protein